MCGGGGGGEVTRERRGYRGLQTDIYCRAR